MNEIVNVEEKINSVKNELIKEEYTNKLISYAKLQELHKKYIPEIKEKTFAMEVLEITEWQYNNMKNTNTNGKVLKKQLTDEVIKEIKEDLKQLGYEEKLINYKEFKELHQKYAPDIEESFFATQILELKYHSYKAIRYSERKRKILKKQDYISEEQICEIIQKLKEEGYENRSITYDELKLLHMKYAANIQERIFAIDVLNFSEGIYKGVKGGKQKGKVLKKENNTLKKDDIQKIKKKLIEDGFKEKIIDYYELKEIYEKYGLGIEEKIFATKVLELSNSMYNLIKNKQNRGKILNKPIYLSKERIEKIKSELIGSGYKEKIIDYAELQKLHIKYAPEVKEEIFATQVLGVSEINYLDNLKRKRTKVRILKNKYRGLTKKEVEKIKQELKEKGYEGRAVDYNELQKLHQKYVPDVEEREFVLKVLGIKETNYSQIKYKKQRGKIIDKEIENKAEYILSNNLSEKRYYTKREIEEICQVNNITKEDFIKYVILEKNIVGKERSIEDYKNFINNKGKVWIGKTNLSTEFFKRNANRIYEIAEKIVTRSLRGLDNIRKDDYIQEAVIYVEKNCGNIEKNYEDNEIIIRMICAVIRKNILLNIYNDDDLQVIKVPLNKKYKKNDKEYEYISDKVNIELEIEDKIIGEGAIQRLKQLVEEGCEKKEALEIVVEEFELTKEELLAIMGEYLNRNGKINITSKTKKEIEEYDELI